LLDLDNAVRIDVCNFLEIFFQDSDGETVHLQFQAKNAQRGRSLYCPAGFAFLRWFLLVPRGFAQGTDPKPTALSICDAGLFASSPQKLSIQAGFQSSANGQQYPAHCSNPNFEIGTNRTAPRLDFTLGFRDGWKPMRRESVSMPFFNQALRPITTNESASAT
jgi:hypothetical protein